MFVAKTLTMLVVLERFQHFWNPDLNSTLKATQAPRFSSKFSTPGGLVSMRLDPWGPKGRMGLMGTHGSHGLYRPSGTHGEPWGPCGPIGPWGSIGTHVSQGVKLSFKSNLF